MGKHSKEPDHTPNGPLRDRQHDRSPQLAPAERHQRCHRRVRSALAARHKVLAAVVATGAFAAVGQPLVANADSGTDKPAAAARPDQAAQQQQRPAAVRGDAQQPADVGLLDVQRRVDQDTALRKIAKSQAIAQERAARADAAQKARAEAQRQERVEAQKRAQAEAEQQARAEAEAQARAEAEWRAQFAKPTTGELTSTFGVRSGSEHNGIDLANEIGTPIVSAAAGEVINAGSASGFGQWVRVQHDDGTITVYGHVDTIDVSEGQHVEAGQQIATMGSEGQSTGPHLHFEVIENDEKIDPLPWLEERGISV